MNGGADVGGNEVGVHNPFRHGGTFPVDTGIALTTLQAVVFAYSAIEPVGIAAGKARSSPSSPRSASPVSAM